MIVIDTNLWISYTLLPDSALGIKIGSLLERYPYAFSAATFTELTDVMMRPKFDRFTSAEHRGEVLRKIAQGAQWFNPLTTIIDCRDAKDNKFLELAIEADAIYLITGDQDLLVLNPYRGVAIITVGEMEP